MATRTIANGGGNWNSIGTWTEGAIPTNADDVVATASSGQLTMDASGACRTIDFTNYVNTFTFNNSAYTLTVGNTSGGSGVQFRFVAGMTVTIGSDSCGLSFIGAGTWDLYFANKTIGASTNDVSFNGTATWTIKDQLSISGYDHDLRFYSGTLTIDNAVTTVGGQMNVFISGTATKTLNMGTATWNIGSGQGIWDVSDDAVANLTLNCGTSKISMTGYNGYFHGGGKTYYNWEQVYLSYPESSGFQVTGNNTFNSVTLRSVSNNQCAAVVFYGNQTIGTFNCSNLFYATSPACKILLCSDTQGTPRTLSVTTMGTVAGLDFRDITAAGTANWNLSAITNYSGDCGGNTGITFTTGAPMYWHHASGLATATGYFSGVAPGPTADLRWFLATNGTGGAGRKPLPQDNAIFDSNSFDSTGLTVILDGAYTGTNASRLSKNITWTGVTNSPTWSPGGGQFYGNITLVSGMTLGPSTYSVIYAGRANSTLTSAGRTFLDIDIKAYGGKLTLADALICQFFTVTLGTFDSANYNITAYNFVTQPGQTATLGTSTISLTGTGGLWTPGGARLPTYDNLKTMDYGYQGQPFVYVPAKDTIQLETMDYGYQGQPFVANYTEMITDYKDVNFFLTDTSATAKSFAGGNYSYNNIYIASSASTPNTTLSGNSEWNNIYFYGQGSVYFTANSTTTLKGTFGLWGGGLQTGGNYTKFGGVSGTLATIYSTSSGTPFYLVKESGNVCCDYMSLRDSYVGGGAKFFAGPHTTSVSNNSGWIMTNATDIQA